MTREGTDPTDIDPTDPWRSDDSTVVADEPAKGSPVDQARSGDEPVKGRAAVHQKTAQFPAIEELDEEPPRRRRMGRMRRRLVALGVSLLVVVGVCLGLRALDLIPSLTNPFATEVTDRSQPPLLLSIQDLERFVGAEGNFQVVIDLQENKRFIPDILFNERTLFVGAGTVDAYVDFGKLDENAIKVSADGKSVDITLPAPELGKPNIDNQRSYVFAQERGLFNRVGEMFGNDPNQAQQLYKLAEDKIGAAAVESEIRERAETNIRKTLTSLIGSLGYEKVTVTFTQP